MSNIYKVILVKSNMCGHCQNFEPIYTFAQKMDVPGYKSVEFEDYDMLQSNLKESFESKYRDLASKIEYYPTVFVLIDKGDKVHSGMIENTRVPDNLEEDKTQQKEAAKKFITNIINGFKTLESDGKSLFLESKTEQVGAGQIGAGQSNNCCSIENNNLNLNYKNKYLKYKNKYLELKKKI
jgi:hypothetical protein